MTDLRKLMLEELERRNYSPACREDGMQALKVTLYYAEFSTSLCLSEPVAWGTPTARRTPSLAVMSL
jgi:hypothetical protein